ncbi:serine/threonine-protein kinase [Mycolicibacterium aichiense]|uniref:non-specific serine/threonine protein kinase n=1 Tax=Mycolicibacterium aichiense TaxID=1799 RepID=A0AAD1M9L5_9MYCO|nr:serine/threonine-protein kinase [Mycolicibacterium aichiense]MCV7020851.1 serine/threonine protein kinase [Mycolicibacterium aichiense]BBX05418.1 serine/threonine protein kinase [Mycolicibacterium aichiense]STZ25230.1 serine/threonine protein kinase [Mycolicibacterium aichiense]
MPLADGQIVAGYTILRTLGAGGMGEVYLVQHPRLPRHDALKVLGSAVSADDEYRKRFNLEADMVATLSNRHIVTIYDRGEFDDKLWIAMEYIDGTDASRLLAERYPYGMPPAEVVRIITGVAEALDYAHSRGLLHRDVKPANILLGLPGTGDERVMLADFGIARWMGQSSDLTGTNMTVGTVAYAAPEQLKGEQIDGHADQYALAATAYHLLTGMPPFQHTNPAIVISQHLSSDPPAIGNKRPELACLSPVFAKALAKDAGKRYTRCIDFARALQQGIGTAERQTGATDVTSSAPVPGASVRAGAGRHARPESGPSRRRLLIPAILGAVVIIAGAAAGLSLLLGHRGVNTTTTAHTPAPPPAVSSRMDLPVVVIGANCAVLGAAAVSEKGAPAYCAHAAAGADPIVWSLQPEKLATGGSG